MSNSERHLHPDFKAEPYWWDAFRPSEGELAELPREAAVAIVGSGYAGLNAALELKRHGIDAVVLEAEVPGFGASTRNAGFVASYGNLSQRYGGKGAAPDPAIDALRHAEALESQELVRRRIEEEGIACFWQSTGSLVPAWSMAHFHKMAPKVEMMNRHGWGARLVPPEEMRTELGSDFYPAGMTVAQTALLHPALYYAGLLRACITRGIPVCARAKVTDLTRRGSGWAVRTSRGETGAGQVIIASNGYTGPLTPQFQRRLVPVGSYMIATEELAEGTVERLIPKLRSVFDSKRVLSYCRPSPDGRRLLFGGRVKFSLTDPERTAGPLYRQMIERFPELDGCRITHAWTGSVAFTFDEASHMGEMDGLHYALGCNGNGIAMMTHLGTALARKIARAANARSCFEDGEFPTHPLYSGTPWFIPAVGQYFRFRDWLDRPRWPKAM